MGIVLKLQHLLILPRKFMHDLSSVKTQGWWGSQCILRKRIKVASLLDPKTINRGASHSLMWGESVAALWESVDVGILLMENLKARDKTSALHCSVLQEHMNIIPQEHIRILCLTILWRNQMFSWGTMMTSSALSFSQSDLNAHLNAGHDQSILRNGDEPNRPMMDNLTDHRSVLLARTYMFRVKAEWTRPSVRCWGEHMACTAVISSPSQNWPQNSYSTVYKHCLYDGLLGIIWV